MMRGLLILAPLLLCSACGMGDTITRYVTGGQDNAEPPAELVEFTSRVNPVELWSRRVGGGTDEQYLKLTPVVAGQRLYVADTGGEVHALDATNGKRIWVQDTDERITGGPGFGDDSVLVGTGEGEVIMLDAGTGKQVWKSVVSSEILSPPLRSGATVVVRTNDGKVYGLDSGNGRVLWIYDRSVPTLTLRGTSAPVIDLDIVVAGFDGGRMAALELGTGRLLWEASVATSRGRSELDRMVDIDSDPLIVDGVIYVVTFQGQLAAIQLESGRILWTREVSSHAGFSADERHIYLSDDNSHVRAFDRFSGATIWEQDKLHARAVTAPASIGDYVVVGDLEGYLHWISKDDGRFAARTRLSKDRIIVQPAVAGKVVFAYASDGTLGAYTYR